MMCAEFSHLFPVLPKKDETTRPPSQFYALATEFNLEYDAANFPEHAEMLSSLTEDLTRLEFGQLNIPGSSSSLIP